MRLVILSLLVLFASSSNADYAHIDINGDIRGDSYRLMADPSVGIGYTNVMPYWRFLFDVGISFRMKDEVRVELNLGVQLPAHYSLFTGASETTDLEYEYMTIRGLDHVTLRKQLSKSSLISVEWLKSNHGLRPRQNTDDTLSIGYGFTF